VGQGGSQKAQNTEKNTVHSFGLDTVILADVSILLEVPTRYAVLRNGHSKFISVYSKPRD